MSIFIILSGEKETGKGSGHVKLDARSAIIVSFKLFISNSQEWQMEMS